jgi:hypothetical protein
MKNIREKVYLDIERHLLYHLETRECSYDVLCKVNQIRIPLLMIGAMIQRTINESTNE